MGSGVRDKSAVECVRVKMAVRNVVAPAPQRGPEIRLKSATRDVSFLRSDSTCRRYVSDLSNVAPRYSDSKLILCNCDFSKFWRESSEDFPTLSMRAFEVITPFQNTYVCEAGFSMITIKQNIDLN